MEGLRGGVGKQSSAVWGAEGGRARGQACPWHWLVFCLAVGRASCSKLCLGSAGGPGAGGRPRGSTPGIRAVTNPNTVSPKEGRIRVAADTR